jgi:3-isopropylmalate/(R)-2-methylmalate dehydratase small subunit
VKEPIRRVASRCVVLPNENIDTDQIYPGRFLTVTTRQALGQKLFADWRFDAEGRPRPGFPLNAEPARGAHVLVAGRNFGCGSSREHACWALRDFGFRAVISVAIADIFRRNALKNGIVPVVIDEGAHAKLLATPWPEVVIDLKASLVTLPDGSRAAFPIEPFARHCLIEGQDEIEFLLSRAGEIDAYEREGRRAPRVEEVR